MRKRTIKASRVEDTAWEKTRCKKCGMMVWHEGREWELKLELFWRILNDRLRSLLGTIEGVSGGMTSEDISFRNLKVAAAWKMKQKQREGTQ